MKIFGEKPILEPWARKKRYQVGLKHVPVKNGLHLADVGCGYEPNLLRFLLNNYEGKLARYIGIDPLFPQAKNWIEEGCRVDLKKLGLGKNIPLGSEKVDCVTAFAFLEHVDFPAELLAEMVRMIKPGGVMIATAPSPKAKLVLETLSFKLGLISKREIAEHKRYFDKKSLIELVPTTVERLEIWHKYFEWGMNNLLVIKKPVRSKLKL